MRIVNHWSVECKGIIYRVVHTETGRSYIGATTKSLKERRIDHIQRAFRGEQGKLQKAIITYGPEAFIWTQIDTANSIDELAQKEKQYILKYNSKVKGFNSDNGGGLKKTVYQFRYNDRELLKSYKSLDCAANAVNADKRTISKAAIGEINSACGYYWSYSRIPKYRKDQRFKKVLQFTVDGILVYGFESIAQASLKTGVNRTSIAKVFRGERKLADGFYWKYL